MARELAWNVFWSVFAAKAVSDRERLFVAQLFAGAR